MKYMLDTNICIYIIKKQPENVLKKFKTLIPSDLCLSSITLGELEYGVQKSQHQHKNHIALQEFILPLSVLPFNEEAAVSYGHLRAALEKQGKPIGALDLIIAAHAKSLKLSLVTNNKKEFMQVPGLKIENWV